MLASTRRSVMPFKVTPQKMWRDAMGWMRKALGSLSLVFCTGALSQLTYPGLDLSHPEPPAAELHSKQKQDEGGKLEATHS